MSTYGKKEKVCATCMYWNGKRNVDFSFIEVIKDEGKCKSVDAFYNLITIKSCCCGCWRRISC